MSSTVTFFCRRGLSRRKLGALAQRFTTTNSNSNTRQKPMAKTSNSATMKPVSNTDSSNDQDEKKSDKVSNDGDKKIFYNEINKYNKNPDGTNASVFRQVQSPPNIISVCRIASAPLLSYWIITGQSHLALYGCIIAGASDYIDGYLAKHYNMSTTLGSFLDPLGDKVIINVLAISLCYVDILPVPLVALWMVKDVGLFFGAIFYVKHEQEKASKQKSTMAAAIRQTLTTPVSDEASKDTKAGKALSGNHTYQLSETTKYNLPSFVPQQIKVNPTFISKFNTALQFLTLGIGIVHPLSPLPSHLLTGLCYTTAVTTIASGLSYVGYSAFVQVEKDQGSMKSEGGGKQ